MRVSRIDPVDLFWGFGGFDVQIDDNWLLTATDEDTGETP